MAGLEGEKRPGIDRRQLLKGAAALAAASLLKGDTISETDMEGMNLGDKVRDVTSHLVDKLSDVKSLDFDDVSKERLAKIAEQQNDPNAPRYIFCPNHVEPHQKMRKDMSIAEDFPVLNKILREAGIKETHPFTAADVDVKFDGPLSKMKYEAFLKTSSLIGETFLGSVPAAVNRFEPKTTQRHNVPSVLKMINLLSEKKGNVAIYPFGTWEASGKQDMSEETAMPQGAFLKPHIAKGQPGYDEWMHALKRGSFMISRVANAPIVPVYVEDNDGHWIIRVGEAIQPPAESEDDKDRKKERESEIAMAQEYLRQMRAMQEESRKRKES